MENIDLSRNIFSHFTVKTCNKFKRYYIDYYYLEDNNDLHKFINDDYEIIYMDKNWMTKCSILEIMSENIIKVKTKNKNKLIYLDDKLFFYKKKNDLRSILNQLMNSNIKPKDLI